MIFPGFILAFIVVILYEYKIRNLSTKPKNKVHFYVARDKDKQLNLFLGCPIRDNIWRESKPTCQMLAGIIEYLPDLEKFGLNISDYKDLKWEDEPVEMFLNLNN